MFHSDLFGQDHPAHWSLLASLSPLASRYLSIHYKSCSSTTQSTAFKSIWRAACLTNTCVTSTTMAPREGVASKQVLPNAARKMAGPQEKAAEKPAQTPAQVSKKMSKISKVPIRSLISERKCKFMRKINRERAGRELLRYTYIIKLNRKGLFSGRRLFWSLGIVLQ